MHNWILCYHICLYSPTHWLPILSIMVVKIREIYANCWQPERISVKNVLNSSYYTTCLFGPSQTNFPNSSPLGAAHQLTLVGTGLQGCCLFSPCESEAPGGCSSASASWWSEGMSLLGQGQMRFFHYSIGSWSDDHKPQQTCHL